MMTDSSGHISDVETKSFLINKLTEVQSQWRGFQDLFVHVSQLILMYILYFKILWLKGLLCMDAINRCLEKGAIQFKQITSTKKCYTNKLFPKCYLQIVSKSEND